AAPRRLPNRRRPAAGVRCARPELAGSAGARRGGPRRFPRRTATGHLVDVDPGAGRQRPLDPRPGAARRRTLCRGAPLVPEDVHAVTDAAPRRRTTKIAPAPEPSEPSTTPPGDATDVPAVGAADGAAPKGKVRRADGLPRRGGSSPAAEERSSLDLARRIVELAEDKKAADIVLLDLGPLTTVADYFVICSGGSERQLEAIAS